MQFRRDMKQGRELGVPFCCRLRFAIEYLFDPLLDPDSGQCLRRGVRFNKDGEPFVPCNVLHKPTLTRREWEKLVNLRVLEGVIDSQIYVA